MENKVADNGSDRRYFTQIPNLIDDTEMSVYAFRLYVHLKRVAGDNGKCWQGTRELAKSCQMSIGKISQSKNELVALGLIEIETKKDEITNNDYHEITIIDVWHENMKRYCSPDEHPPRSQDEIPRSGDEHGRSPHERKNNPIKKNPNKNNSNRGKKRDERLDHPAVQAYRANARLTAPITWRDDIIETVGSNADEWGLMIKEWIGRGWNPRNVSGMLDAFKKGGISKRNGRRSEDELQKMLDEVFNGE